MPRPSEVMERKLLQSTDTTLWEDIMSQEKHTETVSETTNATDAQMNIARRRLTRAALAGPVVLGTLASKQALGGTIPYQCTISGQISGTASARPSGNVDCHELGRSPGFWKNHTACWGITGLGADGQTVQGPYVFFSSIFGGSLDVPMGSILKNCGINDPLARAAIASYLNALHFHTNDPAYPLSTDDVVNLYNNHASGDLYPGCDLKCYFESLYGDSESWPSGYSPANCPSDPNGYQCPP